MDDGSIKAGPFVAHAERQPIGGRRAERDVNRCAGGVLGAILKRLEAAEIDGILDFGRKTGISRNTVMVHAGCWHRAQQVCFKRRDDTVVGEDWRKYAARKIA